ncbi:MAG: hypothetical protein E7813_22190 [Bradyrhizobium sp.]|uniref:hypothetical protein n=1 Tax=Bradyrhizobium sp. TaxID=376 RepID=UPI00120F3A2A|nr:hypothetical protein [Bradyrhizobium sp.]THD61106.1 MAG: hypothetical protein E7813_22190 [Bradyrhizobium sp.]
MNTLKIGFAAVVLGSLYATAGHSQSPMDNLSACLTLEDMTKERLDCFDILVPPAPKKKPGIAKVLNDCKFIMEQDQRLGCFNRFLVQPPPRVKPARAIEARRNGQPPRPDGSIPKAATPTADTKQAAVRWPQPSLPDQPAAAATPAKDNSVAGTQSNVPPNSFESRFSATK